MRTLYVWIQAELHELLLFHLIMYSKSSMYGGIRTYLLIKRLSPKNLPARSCRRPTLWLRPPCSGRTSCGRSPNGSRRRTRRPECRRGGRKNVDSWMMEQKPDYASLMHVLLMHARDCILRTVVFLLSISTSGTSCTVLSTYYPQNLKINPSFQCKYRYSKD